MSHRRKEIDDTLEGLVGVVGMQSPETEVAGLRIGNGRLHRLERANFTDQNDIRSLTHRVDETGFKGIRIEPYLTLSNNRFFVSVDEFNGILNSKNVARLGRVSMIDHRRQRC